MNKYNHGHVIKMSEIPAEEKKMAIKQFAEGSPMLEDCLNIINSLGIETKACCKGQHVTYVRWNGVSSEKCSELVPIIAAPSYILFAPNQEWKAYLTRDLIKDKDVLIGFDGIHYYGRDAQNFFRRLKWAFLTGKKKNQNLLDGYKFYYMYVPEELEIQSYIYSLEKIGFTDEQIEELVELKEKFYNNDIKKEEKSLLETKQYPPPGTTTIAGFLYLEGGLSTLSKM